MPATPHRTNSSPAPPHPPGPAQAAPGCALDLAAGRVAYDRCLPVEGVGSGFWLLWSLLPSPGGAPLVRWGMNSSAPGYVAMAYPPDPEPDTGGRRRQQARSGRGGAWAPRHGRRGDPGGGVSGGSGGAARPCRVRRPPAPQAS